MPHTTSIPTPNREVLVLDPSRRTNAALVLDCVELGYLSEELETLDPTWGLGAFWKSWRPTHLVARDLDASKSPFGSPVDFTALPFADASFDRVVFDPPYKLNGTSTGVGCSSSDAAYGVAQRGSRTQRHIIAERGITECVRVLRPGGMLLVKCQDQVNSGQKRWQTIEFALHAHSLGCALTDQLHVFSHRPQPANRRQLHARQNYSTLLVLKKPVQKTPR